MNIYRTLKLLLIITILYTNTSHADGVRLVNGDTLSGSIIKIQQDVLFLLSPIVGEIEIPYTNIASFSTDQPVSITFSNNDHLMGLISVVKNGAIQFSSQRFGSVLDIQLSDIKSMHKPDSATEIATTAVNFSVNKNTLTQEHLDVDEVVLNSGDHLYGNIQSVNENSLIVTT